MIRPAPVAPNDLDRRIWHDEIENFVPERVFDVHTHLYRWDFHLDPSKETGPLAAVFGSEFSVADWDLAEACEGVLLPGRRVHRLAFPFPFPHPCDFEASNAFLAREVSRDQHSAGLMLVHPGMDADTLDREIERHGFLGLKPYRFYSVSGDAAGCAITDFLPEHQIAVADRRGLVVMLHLSKRDAIADPENVDDVVRLAEVYPSVQWILAHAARSYSSWAIEKAASRLRGLANVWYDTSSVCETDAMDALYTGVGCDRVMYGSDNLPVGALRGKYITFGYAWAYLSPTNHELNLLHCDSRMTFTLYEQLRAMCRAGRRLGMTSSQRQALFHDTAAGLVESVRRGAAVGGIP